jgi:midasin (ATPase involved in ribosome maturation)
MIRSARGKLAGMADEGTLAVIRDALADSERVDVERVELVLDAGAVVLRGSVATTEQADLATMVARQHADEVHNRLRVDPGLREDATNPADIARQAALAEASDTDQELDDSAAVPDRPRTEDWSAQKAGLESLTMSEARDDMPEDVAEALAENKPWNPPTQPHLAPTEEEQRQVLDREQAPEALAEQGERGDGEPSLPGVSKAELERRARPDTDED